MKIYFTFFLILSSFVSFSRNPKIDSLQQVLKNYEAKKLKQDNTLLIDGSDTVKVQILLQLSWEYTMASEYTTAIKKADEALSIAKQIDFKKGISNSYHVIGVIYYSQGNFQEALNNFFSSLKIREEIGNKKDIAATYNNIGLNYWQQGNNPEALKYYFESLKIWEAVNDKDRVADVYNNIGLIYGEQGNYSEALKNHFASLKIKEQTRDNMGISNSYSNIGIIYKEQGNYPEALKYHIASLNLKNEIGDKDGAAYTYFNIGDVYKEQGNFVKALENYQASLEISSEIGDNNGIAASYIGIGTIKIELQEAREGKEWLIKGLKVSKEIGSVEYMKSGYEGLARADSALGNFKDAYENHKLFVMYRDSLYNEETTKKVLQAKMQYDFDKKEAETKALTDAELKKQKLVRNGFIGGFSVVLLFAAVFFLQRNRISNEKLRSDALLLNILPGEVADEIKTSGTAKAKAFTLVTVMFTDFKDFTTVSEKISAELLVDEIHSCFSAFDKILSKYRIEKIKTIGDAYLCASGLPVSNHTHAVDMVSAAFEIRNFMFERKKEKEAKGEISFELRIGIHTGPVVAGVVGVKKYAYDIWGDTVNIAARMEQTSEAGKINISGATYELVKDKFKCEYRGKIQAKNKGEIDMYFAEPTES